MLQFVCNVFIKKRLVLSLQAAAKEGQEAKIIELLGKSPPGLLINTRDREAGVSEGGSWGCV